MASAEGDDCPAFVTTDDPSQSMPRIILTPKLLQQVGNEISAKHMSRLAIGYLDFKLPEVERIERDCANSSDAILKILIQWSYRNLDGAALLCEKFKEAGRKEGLVSVTAVNFLSGIQKTIKTFLTRHDAHNLKLIDPILETRF